MATVDTLADKIHNASLAYQNLRAPVAPGLYSLSELPEETQEATDAFELMKGIGREIAAEGGDKLMVQTYNRAVDKYGYPGVRGVRFAWDGIGSWQA